jgi:hypothetical protein
MNITHRTSINRKKTYIFAFVTLAVITVLWGMSFSPLINPGFWQTLSVFYFCASMLYCVKYCMTEYQYTLTDDEFIIVKIVGQKKTKVCHLESEMYCAVYDKNEWQEHKRNRQITSVYCYNGSYSPEKYYVIVFELDSKNSAVVFEGTEEMHKALSDIIRDRQENQ